MSEQPPGPTGPFGSDPQGPPYPGPPYQGPPYQGPPYQGPQYQGPQGGRPPTEPGQPQPYGQPGGYGPYPGAQPPPPGPGDHGPPGPGGYGPVGPPPRKGNARTLIIIGAVVLVLLALAITGGVLLLNRSAPIAGTNPGSSTQPTTGPGGTNQPPPLANKPSDAVKSYLEALAAGQAQTAIALGDTAPTDTTFLTDAVLAESNRLAPITEINVPDNNDEYAYQVEASFKLGKQPVSENFGVTKTGDQWRLRNLYNEIDLSFSRSRAIPMIVNGVQATSTKLRLFPGAYQFTTGSPNISWGDSGGLLLIQSTSDYPQGASDLRPTLSATGEKAFTAAVTASLEKCLRSKKLVNQGCPNSVTRLTSPYKFKDGTLEWEAGKKDNLTSMDLRLDSANPAVATPSYLALDLRAKAACSAPGGQCELTQYSNPQPRANMLQEPLKVAWG